MRFPSSLWESGSTPLQIALLCLEGQQMPIHYGDSGGKLCSLVLCFGRTSSFERNIAWWIYSNEKLHRKFWHQLLQQPLTSVGAFITRVLGIPSGSSAEQYMNVFIIFFFSGGLHLAIDTVQGIPAEESGAMLFFAIAPLGLMIEDGIKALWRFSGKSSDGEKESKKSPSPLWQKTLGFL